jgi:hypothetical protein
VTPKLEIRTYVFDRTIGDPSTSSVPRSAGGLTKPRGQHRRLANCIRHGTSSPITFGRILEVPRGLWPPIDSESYARMRLDLCNPFAPPNAIFEPRMLLPKSLAILLVAFLPRCKQRINRITRWCQSLLANIAKVCPLRWLVTTAMSYNFMDASCCQWYGLRQAITIKASRWQAYSFLLPSLLIRALKLSLS